MYYEFFISTDAAIVRGIIGYAEMPDLLSHFEAAARRHAAKFSALRGGLLIAEREDNFVALSVSTSESAIPSRCVFDCIEDAMDATFGCNQGPRHPQTVGDDWESPLVYRF